MMRSLLTSLALGLLLVAGQPALAEEGSPLQVIETAVTTITQQLDEHGDELAADRKALYAMIDKELLPHFDSDYAGRLVLGKAWRTASAEQRTRFVDAFYNFLLRSYASAVLKFDQKDLRILPQRAAPQNGRTVIDTRMRLPDGNAVPVSYVMRETADGWKVYDVRIEGISYVQNYRNQFNAEVSARGLDALISRLEEETADIDAGKIDPDAPADKSTR